jgi:hypothetical protein
MNEDKHDLEDMWSLESDVIKQRDQLILQHHLHARNVNVDGVGYPADVGWCDEEIHQVVRQCPLRLRCVLFFFPVDIQQLDAIQWPAPHRADHDYEDYEDYEDYDDHYCSMLHWLGHTLQQKAYKFSDIAFVILPTNLPYKIPLVHYLKQLVYPYNEKDVRSNVRFVLKDDSMIASASSRPKTRTFRLHGMEVNFRIELNFANDDIHYYYKLSLRRIQTLLEQPLVVDVAAIILDYLRTITEWST